MGVSWDLKEIGDNSLFHPSIEQQHNIHPIVRSLCHLLY